MPKSQTFTAALVALAIFVLAAVLFIKPANTTLGSGYIGWPVSLQMATTTVVGPTDLDDTIFNASTENACKSRIVSTTGASAIMLNFGEPGTDRYGNISSSTLSGTIGHWQGPSTTVAYESGTYGCGRWTAFSYATQTITVSEF